MFVLGRGIVGDRVTVKSITGSSVKLSSKQKLLKNTNLTFYSTTNIFVRKLSATASGTRVTITGTAFVSNFGKESIASTFDVDKFISVVS